MNSSFKKCEEFRLCCQYGNDKFYVEEHEENKTLYHIIVKGSGRVGKVFDDNYTKYDEKTNNFVDLKKYLRISKKLLQYFLKKLSCNFFHKN